ncbi:hypothetical protein [Kitasatospora sp. NPDC097643]|uniref:hypothetical protein n=1 Tax=Kitasatospora sp. NPDC097643 TaxID=3157230 RepID=UPI0033278040
MTLEHPTDRAATAPRTARQPRTARPPQAAQTDEVAALRRRIHELECENEILREASPFFTRELGPRRPH